MAGEPTRDRDADLASLRAVQDAARRGEFGVAAELAESALDGGLEHPLLYNVVAVELERSGRLPEAERQLRRAVQLAPTDIGSRNALALCLMQLEHPEQALTEFDALLAISPALPYAHASRGNALAALGRVADAESSFQRAVALDPNQGVALAGLARIASGRGAYAEARRHAQKALEVIPRFPPAVMALAAAELGEHRAGHAEAQIRELLGDDRIQPLERALANGQLGDILDAQNRPIEAFSAYLECNDALRTIYARDYAASGALDYVHALGKVFEGSASAPWRTRPPGGARQCDAAAHVFLLGFPRSGTTLIEVILEGHPDVVSLEENESLLESVRQYMQRPEDVRRLLAASAAELEGLRASYWQLVAAAGVDVAGKTFVDKHPLNTLKLPLITRLFPDAKILFACRDPRDIVLSCFRHRFHMSAPIYELLSIDGAARYYDAVMTLLLRFTSVLPLDVCLVRHEDLVTEFARELKRICSFLGLESHAGMSDFALRTRNRAVLTPSTAQLVRGLNTEGVGQWRRYRTRLQPVLEILGPWIKRFYYDPD